MKSRFVRQLLSWLTLLALCVSAVSPAAAGESVRAGSAGLYHDICFGDPAKARGSDAQQTDRDTSEGTTRSASGHCAWCFLDLGHGAANAPAALSFARPQLRQTLSQSNPDPVRILRNWHLAPPRAPPTLG